MKRNAFVLILLILIIAPTGCRRRLGLFDGLRGSQCGGQTSYSAGAAAAATQCAATQCPVSATTAYGGEIYGGSVDGGVIDGGVIDGGTFHGGTFNGGTFNSGVIDGGFDSGGVIDGGIINDPYLYDSSNGSGFRGGETLPANLAPSLGSTNIYGRPMFQVVGDRKLAPGETLPGEASVSPPTQSDKTAKAPSKK